MGPLLDERKIISLQFRVCHFGGASARFSGIIDARLNVIAKLLKQSQLPLPPYFVNYDN